MASDMLGGVLPFRDSPCAESAWGEKAYAYVAPSESILVFYLRYI